ncbi:MAG: hypothetical protein GY745_05065 [Actinomycetia bacterium]|nr:hypothetical protein [Actinomycetes bacterium]MCP4084411.1 hypothetical protein [Actinomycetes bacterium]
MKQPTLTQLEGSTLDVARLARESAATQSLTGGTFAVAGVADQAATAMYAVWPMSRPNHGHAFGIHTKPRPRWQEVPS